MNQNEQVQKIRAQYTEKEITAFDRLTELDRQVKAPVRRLAYVFGGVAALVMGAGMSLIMTDIGATIGVANPLVPGLILGVVGLAAAVLNYPLYSRRLATRRKKYADKIAALSEEVLNG